MPDFDVNEGYAEAGRRRADSPLPRLSVDGVTTEGRVAPYGLDVTSENIYGDDIAPAWAGEGPRKLPEETPVVRRARHLPEGHFSADAPPRRRVGVKLIARRRRFARRACPYGRRVRTLGTPMRNRRRLWTTCHGSRQLPGSAS
jgi:hypothetical protein